MNLDKQMKKYKEKRKVNPREEKIQETIEVARESFLLAEAEKNLSYGSFLYIQFRLIKKRWWLLQILTLIAFMGNLSICRGCFICLSKHGSCGGIIYHSYYSRIVEKQSESMYGG